MAMTCNFDRDSSEGRKNDKLIVHIAPGQDIGTDTPSLKPLKHDAYLWVLNPRRRSGKSWRDLSSEN